MKKLLLICSVLLLSAATTFAQTTPGFFGGVELRTNDVVATPTLGYIETKFGFETKNVGLAAVYMTDSKARIKQSSMVGAELSSTLFHVDAINFKAGLEALYLLRERRAWRKWAFTPKLSATTTIFKNIEASFTVLDVYHRAVFKASRETPGAKGIIDRWEFCDPGASIGFAVKF